MTVLNRLFCAGMMWVTLLPAAALAASPTPAQSQVQPEVLAAANALGMVRGARQLDLAAINYVLYHGTGTMVLDGTSRKLQSYELSADYTLPALRIDAVPADGSKRIVQVVRGARAWDEVEPGVSPTERSKLAAQRLLQVYATPIGAITAAIEADPSQVKISRVAGRVVIQTTRPNIEIKATLNADQRPETIEVSSRAGSLTATYPEYQDYEKLFAFHPTRMIQRVAGKVVLDITFTAAHSNPYVVFPTPEQLAKAQ